MVLTGELLDEVKSDTKNVLAALFNYGAVGSGSTAETSTDTTLEAEFLRKVLDEVDVSSPSAVTASLRINTGEANSSYIRESGLMEDASSVVDTCETADWSDSADMTSSLNTTTFWEGSAALNLTKDGTTSINASVNKATSSVDFTSKALRLILYIDDQTTLDTFATTSCVTIRLGSDSSNYYEWLIDKSELSVGKNNITNLTSANADSSTGTPVLTACDYTFVQLTTNLTSDVWAAGKVIMDNLAVFGGSMWTRNTLTEIFKTNDINVYIDETVTIEVIEVV